MKGQGFAIFTSATHFWASKEERHSRTSSEVCFQSLIVNGIAQQENREAQCVYMDFCPQAKILFPKDTRAFSPNNATVSSSDQHGARARMAQPFDVPLFITPWCLPRTKLSPFSMNLALGAIKGAQGKQDKCSVCGLQPLAVSIHVTLFPANSSH